MEITEDGYQATHLDLSRGNFKMKKLAIAATLAATMSAGAQAATTYNVTSNITNMGLFQTVADLIASEMNYDDGTGHTHGYFENLEYGGTVTDTDDDGNIDNGGAVTLDGIAAFPVGTARDVRLTFDMDGAYQTSPKGVKFTGGSIIVEINDGGGYVPFDVINLSTTNFVPFLESTNGGHFGQGTAGLSLAPGANTLPGNWDGMFNGVNYNDALGSVTFLFNTAGVWMDGTVTLAP
jgi:hypothetical protein